MAVATGRPLFGMQVTQGKAVYIGMEDQPDSLRRRVHWIAQREQERMRFEGASPEALDRYREALKENCCIVPGVGEEFHLVTMVAGQIRQSEAITELIEKLPRPLELLTLDPLARLHGVNENDNAAATAFINCAERIARETQSTVLIPHHTGKTSAKEGNVSQYSGRGASGFVDASRSSIRLIAVKADAA